MATSNDGRKLKFRNGNTWPMEGWKDGVDNVSPPTEVTEDALREAVNVDLTESGKIRRRGGLTQLLAGNKIHSLWSDDDVALFMDGGDLKQLIETDGSFSSATLLTALNSTKRMRYTSLNNEVYMTNGIIIKRLTTGGTLTDCGVENPSGQPTVSASSVGGMDGGTYKVAVTFLDGDGVESGTGAAAFTTISEGQGLSLSNIPQPVSSDVTSVNMYVSMANSEVLYLHSTIPVGITSSTLMKTTTTGKTLDTQFMQQMPAGDLIGHHNGRLFVVKENLLWFSEPLRYGLYQPATNVIMMPEKITVAESVGTGLFLAADKTYFLKGTDLSDIRSEEVLDYGAVFGTGDKLSSTDSKLNGSAVWFSDRGLCVGQSNGAVTNIMEDKVAVDEYLEGELLYREFNGIQQVMTLLRDTEQTNSLGVSDMATAEIRRNGVIIT